MSCFSRQSARTSWQVYSCPGANTASGHRASVSGGDGNIASGNEAGVSGGVGNTAGGSATVVIGGHNVMDDIGGSIRPQPPFVP